jgi:endonuclease I
LTHSPQQTLVGTVNPRKLATVATLLALSWSLPAHEAVEQTPRVAPLPQPSGYYDGTESLSGEALKAKLQTISQRNQRIVGYRPTRPLIKQIDEDPANPDNVITIYARTSVPKANFAEGPVEVAWDREHVIPQGFGARGGEFARSDLHNLFPSIRFVNSARGHLYFDDSDEGAQEARFAPLASFDEDSWEPPEEIKGDMARVAFYMDTRYNGSDSTKDISLGETPDMEQGIFAKLSTLLRWHREDPVSDEERRRNNLIFSAQGNRNPFVDRPEFVDKIYGDGGE